MKNTKKNQVISVIIKTMKMIVRNFLNFSYKYINKFYFFINHINIGEDSLVNGFIFIKNNGDCKIGNKFRCNSGNRYNPIGGDTKCNLIINKDAVLTIGEDVGISNCSIVCKKRITIGNNVLVGGGVKIWDSDFHSIDYKIRLNNDNAIINKEIFINDNVWIGALSIVLKGVTIGENSIVGAGSVVTKDIPKNEIWAGNPAKFIKKI